MLLRVGDHLEEDEEEEKEAEGRKKGEKVSGAISDVNEYRDGGAKAERYSGAERTCTFL